MSNVLAKRGWIRYVAILGTSIGLIVVACIVATFHNASAMNELSAPSVDPATSCGPVSLGLVGRWLGVTRKTDELARLTNSDDTGTTSLLDLKKAARSMGLAAEGVRLAPQDPFSWRLPMILHMRHHFAAAMPVDAESVVLADPPYEPLIVSRADLSDRWDGIVLIVAKSQRELATVLEQAHLKANPGN